MPIEGTSRLEQVLALEAGRAFVDLSSQRLTLVTGKDARGWLNDLVTAPVARLTPGDAVRSLLLSPTGHVRADLDIACLDEGFLLLQDPNQPDPIAELLARYVLSSHVMLADRSGTLCLLGMGSSVHPPAVDWAAAPWETDGTFAAHCNCAMVEMAPVLSESEQAAAE
jgi:folate-binding Fe-S cluster repair protein YgfZ